VYESLCGACYLEESGGVFNRGRRVLAEPLGTAYNSAPDPDFA
jgi:thymidine kinase